MHVKESTVKYFLFLFFFCQVKREFVKNKFKAHTG